MRGQFTILVVKRTHSESKRYKDLWQQVDKLKVIAMTINNLRVFRLISLNRGLGDFIITRDELAFIKLIYSLYKEGDYCIRTWAKGKEVIETNGVKSMVGKTGIRTFWDGVITIEKTFYRRKNTGYMKDNPGFMEKSSFADSDQRIADFMKVKPSGKWYNF